MKLEFSWQIFEKYSNITHHENPSSRNRVVPCGQMDGQTAMTNLIVAFRYFSNAPKNSFGGTLTPYIPEVTTNTARFNIKQCYMLPDEWIYVL
jgi:hypothetical protein